MKLENKIPWKIPFIKGRKFEEECFKDRVSRFLFMILIVSLGVENISTIFRNSEVSGNGLWRLTKLLILYKSQKIWCDLEVPICPLRSKMFLLFPNQSRGQFDSVFSNSPCRVCIWNVGRCMWKIPISFAWPSLTVIAVGAEITHSFQDLWWLNTAEEPDHKR